MAVVPRSLAHPSSRPRSGLVLILALVFGLLAQRGETLDIGLDSYRNARRAGAVGVVAGRAYAEARTPDGPERPIQQVTVLLLPRSAAFRGTLERLKARSRESAGSFAAAAPAIRKAKEDFERELVQAGAPDLAMLVAVDREGGFRIEDVPAGEWMLLGWHSAPVDVSPPKLKAKDRELYRPQSRLEGYQSVTVWLQDITVTRGGSATVELNDRNGWFRGVIEERTTSGGR